MLPYTFDSIPYMPRIPFPVVQKFESAQWELPSHYLSVVEGNDGFSYDYTIVSGCNIPSCKTFLIDLEELRDFMVCPTRALQATGNRMKDKQLSKISIYLCSDPRVLKSPSHSFPLPFPFLSVPLQWSRKEKLCHKPMGKCPLAFRTLT